jgi:putative transposase
MSSSTISYRSHRFPPQIIARAVWLYFRFPLSLRLVEEMLLERGIVASYETIRRWRRKFGPAYAKQLCRKDIRHLDEVAISIGGRKHWLWRAVDRDSYVLDEIVQTRRNSKAAKRLLLRLLKKQDLTPKAHHHRQIAILWRRKTRYHAQYRASIAQGCEQSGGEFSLAPAKTRANDAGVSIGRRPEAIRSTSPWSASANRYGVNPANPMNSLNSMATSPSPMTLAVQMSTIHPTRRSHDFEVEVAAAINDIPHPPLPCPGRRNRTMRYRLG